MSWKDTIKNAFFEDTSSTSILEDEPKEVLFEDEPDASRQSPMNPVVTQPPIAAPIPVASSVPPPPTPPESGNHVPENISVFVDRLKAKTDFESTPVGQQVSERLMPLEGLPLTETQKMSVVLKGGAKDGLTGEKIVTTLQGLLEVLDREERDFNASVATAAVSEVDPLQEAIQDEAAHAKSLEDQLSASRQKHTELSAKLLAAQSEIERHKEQFQAVFDTRSAELQKTINHYQSLLQGNQTAPVTPSSPSLTATTKQSETPLARFAEPS